MTFYADANSARLTFNAPAPALGFILKNGGTAYLPERMVENLIGQQRLYLLTDGPVFERPVFLNAKESVSLPETVWAA